MGVCNEDNKSKEGRLCRREGGLYVGSRTTLGPVGLSRQ